MLRLSFNQLKQLTQSYEKEMASANKVVKKTSPTVVFLVVSLR
jgi:hypothetical protein